MEKKKKKKIGKRKKMEKKIENRKWVIKDHRKRRSPGINF